MTQRHDHLDALITRRLDGELTDEQRLELDREVLRSPDVRERFDHTARIDSIAGEAVRSAVEKSGTSAVPPTTEVGPAPARSRRTLWWALPLAAAAGLAAGLWLDAFDPGGTSEQPASIVDAYRTEHPGPAPARTHNRNQPLRPVYTGHGPRLTDHVRDVEWIAVRGDDGSIYLLQVDRHATHERPRPHGGFRLASDDL